MSRVRPAVPTVPASQKVLCPYCGEVSGDPRRCESCRGFFDPLSRQATQNAMGPWFIRETTGPWRPGCSIETVRELIRRGKVTRETVLRGPGTKQFWNFAGRTPSIANLLGICHNCRVAVKPDDYSCKACGAVFTPDPDRQHMGLAPVHVLPGEASPEMVAAASMDTPAPVPVAGAAPMSAAHVVPAAKAEEPSERVQARSAPVKQARTGSRATGWLVGATVVVLLAMGVVLTLVAMGKLTIPGLNDLPAGPGPKAEPPQTAAVQTPETSNPSPPKPVVEQPAAPASQPIAAPSDNPAASESESPKSTSPPVEPPAKSEGGVDLTATLLPLFRAEPLDEGAISAKIESLRREHPSLGAELDSWAAAAKVRAEQVRLRRIP